MPIDRNRILDQFNNEQTLGKFAGRDNRNPQSISQGVAGPYNVNQLVYPEDLTNRADLQHYIVFYINARGKTKFRQQKVVDVNVSSAAQNRTDVATNANQAQVAASVAGGAAIGGAVGSLTGTSTSGSLKSKIGDALKLAGKRLGAPIAVVGGAVGGAVAGGAVASLFQFSDTFSLKEPERVTDAIMLPIDSIPQVKYSMKYKEFDFGALAGLLGGSSAIESSLAGRTGEFLAGSVASLGGLASAAGLGQTAATAAKFAAKVSTNPFKEVLFEAIDFRTFSFNYTFLPKSETEVHNVRRIIDLFKFHMHPELSKDGLFYVYPSEFEMQYYYRGEENNFLHRISTCVLTDMSVTYGKDYFASFRDGEPVETQLSLTFKEVELLTKERIIKGY